MSKTVGIDLGTTNSAVGIMVDGMPRLIPNAIGKYLTPSVIGIDESGEVLVGSSAKEYQTLQPERCVSGFKRRMGTNWNCKIDSHTFSAIELSSLVLGSLKGDAESHLNTQIHNAVITVPAYFNNDQRQATIEAGKIAGFQVERIINEPTAAALAYGVHETDTEKTIAVFDLGGGTFDISIVDFFEGAIEVRSSAGEAILGGEDFTRALAMAVLNEHSIIFEHAEVKSPKMVARLIQQCENAKVALSKSDSFEIFIPDSNGDLAPEAKKFTVDRSLLNEACEPILSRIAIPIRRAIGDAKLKRENLDQVILVGGATRMPSIVGIASNLLGHSPSGSINPDEVVALGAVVQAGLIDQDQALDEVVVVDVAPFSLGVEIAKKIGDAQVSGYYLPIINRNTVIPTSRSHSVGTMVPNQQQIQISVFQGEGRMVKDNLLLGKLLVDGIPLGPAGQQVEIRFTYDSNGILEVETTVTETKKQAKLVITKSGSNLSDSAIKKALASMAKLKIHPREKAENKFLMKRAERLFQELPLGLRKELEFYLDSFESAMESHDAQQISGTRQQLSLFLSAHDCSLDDDNID